MQTSCSKMAFATLEHCMGRGCINFFHGYGIDWETPLTMKNLSPFGEVGSGPQKDMLR